MKSLSAYASEQEQMGFFRIFATPPGGVTREITLFRDAPIKVSSVVTQDPFTHTTATLSCPQITVWDTPGEGDLKWLVPNCNIDIVFANTGAYNIDWKWEGYIASYNLNLTGADSSFELDLKGAFYGLDDYLAMPMYPNRPIPYEILIAMAFDQDQHPCSLGRFRMMFPDWWTLRVKPFKSPDYLSALKPWGVRTHDPWTGITTRQTGSWDALLSSHVQTLLSNMFAEGGAQWSIRNRGGRRPELYLREIPDASDDSIIEIVLGAPGVELQASRDYTQRTGVVYGYGTDEAGISFSNVQVSPDGKTTYYKPFAWNPEMYPRTGNPNFNKNVKPKETVIQFDANIDEVGAQRVAEGQYQRFSEPGITGSVTLTTDPRLSSGQLMPRLLIQGGQTMRLNGLLGVRDGVLAHITQASADFDQMTTSLTFDTKYRDQLTVEQVQARTRDALNPVHALQVGKYANTIQDLVLPWSYSAGSGMLPLTAKEFFNEKLAPYPDAQWPFEKYTKMYPPSNPDSSSYYVKIGPMDPNNSTKNWSSVKRDGQPDMAIPIRLSQAGTIRLSQVAAYDKNGNVMRVKFHVSVYMTDGIAVHGMPQFPVSNTDPLFPKQLSARQKGIAGVDDTSRPVIPTHYGIPDTGKPHSDQTYPFYKGAWETTQPNGEQWPWNNAVSAPNPPPLVGWGNFYEPAGYWPGRYSKGASRTGLLQDDAQWQWNETAPAGLVSITPNTQTTPQQANAQQQYAGMAFVMIYCDDQLDEPVYFMGRFIRMEPGQSN